MASGRQGSTGKVRKAPNGARGERAQKVVRARDESASQPIWRRIAYWGLVACLWGAILLGAGLLYISLTLPDTSALWNAARAPAITVVADDGEVLAHRGQLFGGSVRAQDLPPHMIAAVVATEDRRFYSHFGVDPLGIARAVVVNARAGHVVQGGSTITQQLAKNVFLTPDQTLKRKAQEMLLALWLESRFTKDEILSMYLNRVYFGGGAYGIEAAAQRYFNKSAREVGLTEAAMLAGLLKAPSRLSPTNDIELARDRANVVLRNMEDAGYLTETQLANALERPANLASYSGTESINYFVDWIANTLPSYANHPDQDLVVTTTIDPKLQRAAEAAVATWLRTEGEAKKIGQAALIAMTPDGAIKAMVGGRSYKKSQFNRAVQAQRQPGSAFKAFVYLTAMEEGYTPESRMVDRPISINGYSPSNYSNRHRGEVSLREALAQSINTVAVELANEVGIRNVIKVAHRLGLKGDPPADLSVALGSWAVSPLDLTAAFASFANNGNGVIAHGIRAVETPDGDEIYRRSGSGLGPVMSAEALGEMNNMLSSVVSSGTGRRAKLGNRPVAGKTGTSQDYRDAWFVGYTGDLVVGVWVGNDDNSPMDKVSGGTVPTEIWHTFMTKATEGTPVAALPGRYQPWKAPGKVGDGPTSLAPPEVAAGRDPTAPPQGQERDWEEPGFFERLFSLDGDGGSANDNNPGNDEPNFGGRDGGTRPTTPGIRDNPFNDTAKPGRGGIY